jgi:hypothetical protein
MKKLLSLTSAVLLTTLLQSAASAGDRVIAYPQTNPPSQQANLGPRLARLSNGTFIRDALGPSAIAGGVYANLSVLPNGGMNLAVAPTSSTLGEGALYQLGQDDPLPIPQSSSSTSQLSADTTPIAVNALQAVSIGGLGPIAAPATGSSIYVLVEGQVQTKDTTPFLFTTFAPSGGQGSELEPSVRSDQVVYQLKYGTPAATPTKPTVDAGWIPIAFVDITSGTSTITTGMITPVPPFAGFAQNGLAGSFSSLKLSNVSTAGCLQSDSSGNISSQTCTSGLGNVVGTAPSVTASTSGGTATVSLSHGDYDDIVNAQTITGGKTFSQNVAVGGGLNTYPALTVSNNPSSTSYSPRIYVAQNIAGGGKYGFDSLNNQFRVLYTPYVSGGGGSEVALGYFDNLGQYHVGATTLGANTNISGNLTSATLATSGSSTFGTGAATTELSLAAGFSGSYPTINNSSDGGLNFTTASSDVNGYRFFKYNGSTTTLTTLGSLDQSGNFVATGTVNGTSGTFPNGVASGSSSYGPNGAVINGNTNVNNTLNVGGNANVALAITGASAALTGAVSSASLSTGSAAIASALNVGSGGVTTTGGLSVSGNAVINDAVQIGPSTPASNNYIVHGQTGTYIYLNGAYNGNTHMEAGIIENAGAGDHYAASFNTPFASLPICVATAGANGSNVPSSGLIVLTSYTPGTGGYIGVAFLNGTNTLANISWQCVGY